MILEPITPPTTEPVTLDEAKAHMNITTSDDNDFIDGLIVAAREHVERILKQSLVTQTWNVYRDGFDNSMEIPRPPLKGVTAIHYLDTTGTTRTLSSDIYTVDTVSKPGLVTLAYNQSWPDTMAVHNSVWITFVSGYGGRSLVPQRIKQAILLLVGHWYLNREITLIGTSTVSVPYGFDTLITAMKAY